MSKQVKYLLVPLTILIFAIIFIKLLIPSYHPFGSLSLKSDENKILHKAKTILDQLDADYSSSKLKLELKSNKDLINWIQSENKIDKANEMLKQNGFAYYWSVSQQSQEKSSIVVSSNSDAAVKKLDKQLQINMLDDGSIIKFEQEIDDSVFIDSTSSLDVNAKILSYVSLLRNDLILSTDSTDANSNSSVQHFYLYEAETLNKSNQIEYRLNWQTKCKDQIDFRLKTTLIGNKLKSFEIEPIVPAEYTQSKADVFEIASTLVFILAIVIAVVVVGFRKFRAYEIGFKKAIIFGVIVLLSFTFKELLAFLNNFQFTIVIGLIFGGILIAGAALILWAVSETVFREVWNEKFLSIDLIFHRKPFHSVVGKVIVNSISFGLGLSALYLLLIFASSFYSTINFYGESFTSFSHLTASIPLLDAALGVFNAYALLLVSFFMFLSAAIKRYIVNDYIFVFIVALIWAIFVQSNILPLTDGLPINFFIGLLLTTILVKYDLLTAISSFMIFHFFIKVSEFSFTSLSSLTTNWIIVISLFAVLLIAGILLIFKRDSFTDYESITPKFVENITERQRLKKELEVARHVQMSFLPKVNPVLDGIDISSICIPAFEVGGDYYDFIQLSDNKLGIIIGDVSGKGTQAAFYMTLTKGFLKALAKQTDSPAEVLTKMNELFYENVERGRFISMIYAIVDLKFKTIRIARAGHNPVIYHDTDGKINLINPNGLALGLESGNIFGKVITEYQSDLKSGKIFILYTDGFTEAVNKKREEYGLERMFEIARLNSSLSAKELKDKLVEDVNKFIGKAPQHDDMTMVILKIA